MSISDFERYVICLCAAASVAGCGGTQLSPSSFAALRTTSGERPHVQPAYGVIYSFQGFPNDGAVPYSSLLNVKGTLYGTTYSGGGSDNGTTFAVAAGKEVALYSFGGSGGGAGPKAGVSYHGGKFFGTTTGSTSSKGTVFTISSGKQTTLYHFKGGKDGATPTARLLEVSGIFYGTTKSGGTKGAGTVFSISSLGAEHVIHSFGSVSGDGAIPLDGLFDFDGTLYGTTQYGGAHNVGTVFTISTSGAEQVIYSFGAVSGDGAYPKAALTNGDGTLYGTTENGGAQGAGTVFSISSSGAEHVVYSFHGSDGKFPVAGLIDVNGTLYGTTGSGGAHGRGVVFAIDASGSETVLHSFGLKGDGAKPQRRLIYMKGTLYGTTASGGAGSCPGNGCGTVFSLTP